MASGMTREKPSLDSRLTCSLCLEPFRGRNPKLLQCFHTFCLSCLTTLAEQATENKLRSADHKAESNGKDSEKFESSENLLIDSTKADIRDEIQIAEDNIDDNERKNDDKETVKVTFLCPTCRTPVTVPEGGVNCLQTNFYLEIFDPVWGTPDPLCNLCEHGDQQKASYACEECEMQLCTTCRRRYHDSVAGSRGHHVRPIHSDKLQVSKPSKQRCCPYHPDQPLCFHCRQCDAVICLHCKLTSHEGHVTEDIMAATIRAKGELVGLTAKGTEQIRVMETVIGRLERNEKELARQKQEIAYGISARYESIVTWAARARDELTQCLTLEEESARNNIHAEKMAARNTTDKLYNLVSRANSVSSEDDDTELVTLKAELQAAMLSEEALYRNRQLVANGGVLPVFFVCSHDDSALELDTVRAFMGELMAKDDDPTDTSLSLSLRELKSKFVELSRKFTSEVEELKSEIVIFKNESSSLEDKLKSQICGKLDDLVASTANTSKMLLFCRLKSTITSIANQPIKFNVVDFMDENVYDVNTGIFTTPVDGKYFVHAVVVISGNVQFFMHVDNNRTDSSTISGQYSNIFFLSINVVRALTAGQKVSMVHQGGYHLYGMDNGYNTFFTVSLIN